MQVILSFGLEIEGAKTGRLRRKHRRHDVIIMVDRMLLQTPQSRDMANIMIGFDSMKVAHVLRMAHRAEQWVLSTDTAVRIR